MFNPNYNTNSYIIFSTEIETLSKISQFVFVFITLKCYACFDCTNIIAMCYYYKFIDLRSYYFRINKYEKVDFKVVKLLQLFRLKIQYNFIHTSRACLLKHLKKEGFDFKSNNTRTSISDWIPKTNISFLIILFIIWLYGIRQKLAITQAIHVFKYNI